MSRMLALLVALLVVLVVLPLVACSAEAGPAAPSSSPSTTVPRAAPYRLDRADALDAVRAQPPRGFEVALTCRGRTDERCRRPDLAKVRWFVATMATGAPLPDGNGLREQLIRIVTAWPSVAAARRYVRRTTEDLRRYRGEYDIALHKTGPRTYTPGDRGRGELHEVSSGSLAGYRAASGLPLRLLRARPVEERAGGSLRESPGPLRGRHRVGGPRPAHRPPPLAPAPPSAAGPRVTLETVAPFWRHRRYRGEMATIQIKHVPEETHAVLTRRAAAAHQSLQEYLLAKLIEDAAHPTNAEIFDEIDAEFEREGGGGTFTLQEVVDIIREDRESH